MDMESKLGLAPSVEAVWRHEEFEHIAHPRSARLMCRRVESHCKVATYLLRARDKNRGGRGNVGIPTKPVSDGDVAVGGVGVGGGDGDDGGGAADGAVADGEGSEEAETGAAAAAVPLTESDRVKLAAADARRFAAAALDELYQRISMVPISHVGETTTAGVVNSQSRHA